jgi:DNA topoisomerase-6 subunit A
MYTYMSSSDGTPTETESLAEAQLLALAQELLAQLDDETIPQVQIPTRTKNNIEHDAASDVWLYGDKTSATTANSVKGAKKLLKLSYVIDFLRDQLAQDKSSTLRELYYLSESWDETHAKFGDQSESDSLIEDLEIVSDVRREEFHIRPEESGAKIMGPLLLQEQTNRGAREIHCQKDVGQGGYQIPNNPDTIEFVDHDADFVLAVETGGMRDRLVENGFDEDYNALVVHLGGQPARATRRIIKRFHDELDLPVAVFTDGDPWSYRIYGSVAYGSIKSAHLSKYLATPEAIYLGITPQDIIDYDLPTDDLSDSDVNALESELTDPRFDSGYWKEQIELQLELNKKAEQQALASQGLDFVTDTYLPDKLDEHDSL